MKKIDLNSPIWKIFVGPRYQHCKYLFLVFIPHFLTAIFEGGSFAFILLAFSSLEGKPIQHLGIFSKINLPKILGLHLEGIQLFYFYILVTVSFQALRGCLNYIALIGISSLSLKIQTLAQRSVCQQIFRFSFPFVSKYQIGDLAEYVKSPAHFIPHFFEYVNRIMVSFSMGIGLLSILTLISWKLTFITLSLFSLFALAQKFLIRKISLYSKKLTAHLVEFTHEILQSLQAVRLVHLFSRQKHILKKIEMILSEVSKVSKRLYLWSNSLPVLNETVSILLVGVTLILGSFVLNAKEGAILSSLLTYIALTYRLATRLQIGMSSLGTIGTYWGSILRLNEILQEKDKEYLPKDRKTLDDWKEEIVFENVFFQYPKSSSFVLHQLNFKIKKGTTVAFVGLSGAGKSSILDLILGLHPPSKGRVLIDEVPLQEYDEASWRRHIGVVSQELFTFHDTIEENIRFGDDEATEDAIYKAMTKAHALEFVEKLSSKQKTVIGEKGQLLSGGEKQRISLARALLKDPDILVLDEATSHLDSYSEQKIQESLDALQGQKTLILVSHRLSTVYRADSIFVLEEGRIIEEGTHEELLEKKGRYASFWNLQMRSFEGNESDVVMLEGFLGKGKDSF